jgi:hypothetical protein
VEATLVVLVTFLLLAAVLRFVGAPLRAARRRTAADGPQAGAEPAAAELLENARARAQREALESARAAKYREIRDAELDYRTGKLSPQDYEAVDATLRAEAIEILDRLDPPPAQPQDG